MGMRRARVLIQVGGLQPAERLTPLLRQSCRTLIVPSGTAFAQGIFLPFGITVDDHAQGVRNGGLGSTTGH